ncbi:hypothetical protein SteCoe_36186 [Stentor coeruleus]|uniref:PFU domain-containing protein n=1 Tax=Stentor coeruleus TaxID=5963 RepID=A0A1R2AQN3_9CILI|nr:hypothetical protein SteCoe_36186 [Stentor coeruleus]
METDSPELYFPELSPIENNLLGQNYSIDEGEVILIITIDIGDGRKDEIKVYEHDDSDQLALDFCHKHNLGARAKLLLSDEIEKYLKIAINKTKTQSPTTTDKSTPTILDNNSIQSPQRPRRNQTFSQRSMKVKQNMLRNPSQETSKTKIPVTSTQNRLNSVDSFETNKLRKSNNKNQKKINPGPLRQSPEPKKQIKVVNEKSNKRCNSLYEPKKLIEHHKTEDSEMSSFKSFSPNKSLWVPECSSKLDISQDHLPNKSIQAEDIKTNKNSGAEKSERIMKKIKYQRYKDIFNLLLPDTKGVITIDTVSKSQMPQTIKKIISPLLEELSELNETLDFNEFYDAMEMLMKVLTPGEKSALLLPVKAKVPTKENYDFRPKTNVGQGKVSTVSLYERSLQRQQDFSRRIQKEREMKEENEMKECKFAPTLIALHRKTISNNTMNAVPKGPNDN